MASRDHEQTAGFPQARVIAFARKREIVKARRAFQRERDELTAAGYRMHETDWEIHRGGDWGKVILDAKISQCGKYVWTKIGPKPDTPT